MTKLILLGQIQVASRIPQLRSIDAVRVEKKKIAASSKLDRKAKEYTPKHYKQTQDQRIHQQQAASRPFIRSCC